MKSNYLVAVRIPLAVAFAVAAFSAQAADLYAPGGSAKDGPMYEAIPSWNGFYAGVNGGYAWSAVSSGLTASATDITAATAQAVSSKLWANGGFGGGQLGYNFQRDRFVFGVETDIQGGSLYGRTNNEAVSPGGNVTTDAWAKSSLDWFGTVRGRAGYAYGGYLIYGTGGFAYGGARDSLGESVNGTPISTSANRTLTGYVAGGGIETALTPSWSVKAEYQYLHLGSTNLSTATDVAYAAATVGTGSGDASDKFDHSYHTVRLGLNYKFNQVYEPLK